MKEIEVALDEHLASSATKTLWTCLYIQRKDEEEYGFVEGDQDLEIDDILYEAAGSYTSSNVDTDGSLGTGSLEIVGFLNSARITEEDLDAGVWDGARYRIFQVNWKDLTQGTLEIRRGTFGQVKLDDDTYTVELRPLSQAYQTRLLQFVTPGCTAVFGDAKCKFPIATVTWEAIITAVGDNNIEFTFAEQGSPLIIHPTGYYDYGLARWTNGNNSGYEMEIKSYVRGGSPIGSRITLQLPMPKEIEVGDTLNLIAGCAKRFEEDCKRWDNVINFRGFPHLPGRNKMIQIARRS